MTLSTVLTIAIALFPISEIALAIFRRASRTSSEAQDRGSMWVLWAVIFASVFGAVVAQRFAPGRIPISSAVLDSVALALLVLGLVVRWLAIITLGRYFTVNVAIAADHRIVDTGLYRFVRHPSYTGLLVAFLGMGLGFHNWLSLAVLMIPITAALFVRITVEERALHAAFGPDYAAYCARTRRLVPWLL